MTKATVEDANEPVRQRTQGLEVRGRYWNSFDKRKQTSELLEIAGECLSEFDNLKALA